MHDTHQVNAMIATTVCEFFKDHSTIRIASEEAKLLGKLIVEALNGAGLEIAPSRGAGTPDHQTSQD
ncbi:hypothetical protein [Bradyrhizobium sp. 195]|uniref:hypothetical protein n=1 Tax=Bradyrhizobium sp. 195 TaxID=2782662 RepID=UPI002001B033|nr:hypothetical protein [Bradyrhizobium sp. 195]UPK30949.1 hypothetical protein IVB26_40665 [Bradyrhizobium sp. 195]